MIAAAWSGKIKTASTMVCICVMFVFPNVVVDTVVMAIIVLTTLYSGVEYFIKNRDIMDWKNM